MKIWHSAAEIAELALPGLPTTRESVIRLAARENWERYSALCRPREGRGGGMEYHVALLPVASRVAYMSASAGPEMIEAAAAAMQSAPDASPGLGSQAALERDARIAIIGSFHIFRRTIELKSTTALIYFVDLYNTGWVEAADWMRQAVPRLSCRTLRAWLALVEEGEVDRLGVDRGAARRGKGLLDAALDGRIKLRALALVAQNPQYTGRQIWESLRGHFGDSIDHGGKAHAFPGLRALEGALKRWKSEHKTELLALTNPDKFVSTTRVAGSYEHMAQGLNDLWQIDASPVDALCIDGRHSVYICIDVWSRRIILSISRTPRSEAVQLLIRKAILAWGVPNLIKTDNGSDFIARATKRLFAALNIHTEQSVAFSPWQKGVVERAVRTFQTDCGRMLPGFIGHNVGDRKQIESRKAFAARLGTDDAQAFSVDMTSDELATICDRWASEIYAQRVHGGIKATPFARAASWTGTIARPDAQALNVLLMPAAGGDGQRVVGKKGVRIEGYHYLCPGLLVGDRVFVRMDPADKGRAHCFTEDGESYLGLATCPELAGIDPAALLSEVQAAQKALVKRRTAEISQERKGITNRTVMQDRLALAEMGGNLVAFPARETAHTSRGLEAAAEVVASQQPAPLRAATPEFLALQAEIEADLAAATQASPPANVTRLRITETPAQRFRRAHLLEAQIVSGDAPSTEEALWLGGYQASGEYRAQKTVFDEFGEAALR